MEKRLRFLEHFSGDGLYGSMKKAKLASKVAELKVSQGWTLTNVFRFFHSASVGVPKTFAFSLFSSHKPFVFFVPGVFGGWFRGLVRSSIQCIQKGKV